MAVTRFSAQSQARAVPKVRIERLCWLAVRNQLARRERRNPVMPAWWVRSMARAGRGSCRSLPDAEWLSADLTSKRVASFGFAVYDVAQELSVAERQVLRSTGKVPDWFLPAVHRRRREMRRRRFF
jgi:hypothetical protein